ncbi:MAG: cytochrome P460 family protein [Methylophilaceae bacterium]
MRYQLTLLLFATLTVPNLAQAEQKSTKAGDVAKSDANVLLRTFNNGLVDKAGNIRLPKNFRQNWVHMGSWIVADPKAPGNGFHDVYTQREAVKAYRKTGKFLDGTVLVKEIRNVESGDQTTGHVQWAGDNKIWFVMVKDSKNRFTGNPNWEEGWGWGLYEVKNPSLNVSKGFKATCLGCHTPAKNTDWVYINGYPTLKP